MKKLNQAYIITTNLHVGEIDRCVEEEIADRADAESAWFAEGKKFDRPELGHRRNRSNVGCELSRECGSRFV